MRVSLLALSLVVMSLTPGCGAVRFRRAWSSFESDSTRRDLEGRWDGEWHSHFNGHAGGLRCVVTRAEDGSYHAWFYSTYALVLFFQYETDLKVTSEEAGRQRFEGEQDLGSAVGGVYRYRGYVDGDDFHAHFRADNGDHGVFAMRRVVESP